MRTRLLLIGLPVLTGLCWLFYSHQTHPLNTYSAVTEEARKQPNSPAVTIKQITLHEYSKKKDYELILTADQSSFNHHSETVACQSVVCTILKKNSDIAALYATQAIINRTLKIITCNGPVHGQHQGITLQGNDIAYNFEDQIMTTQQPMIYRFKGLSLTAGQSTANIEAQSIEMWGGVTTELENT